MIFLFSIVGFDAMGLTDNQNPIGLLPFLNPGLGILGKKRKRRDLPDPDIEPHEIAGGERYSNLAEKLLTLFLSILSKLH